MKKQSTSTKIASKIIAFIIMSPLIVGFILILCAIF